jgi:(2R)-3-sulfolactate dehydrogenase (NADP+)
VVRVDAGTGFAYPALDAGFQPLLTQARRHGIAAVAITNSHHFGVAGHFVERLADQGLVGLGFGNAPAAIAPWGGKRPLFGTDPIAFAAPRTGEAPLVVDLSVSRVARGKIMMAQRRGDPIPEGWAIDAEGRATTDADAAMAGSVLPMGEAKGAALALMVELLAAGLTGSSFAYEASSLFDAEGPAPRLGQFFIAIDPAFFQAGAGFADRVGQMCAMIEDQPEARLPGARRLAARGEATTHIDVGEAILADLQKRVGEVS